MEFLQPSELGLVTHAIAALAFLLLTILLISGWRWQGQGIALIAACALTTFWTAAVAATMNGWLATTWLASESELLRTGAWLVVLIVLRGLLTGHKTVRRAWRSPSFLLCVALLIVGFADAAVGGTVLAVGGTNLRPGLLAGLGLAILGLLLVESLFKLTNDNSRWAFKHLVIGLGALFGFDLVLYSEALLFNQFDSVAIIARPLVNAAAIPLIAVAAARIRHLSFEVTVSRGAALQTTALVASGIYLVAISTVGYLMREADITWGPVLQVVFVCGAIVLLVTVLMSGQVRARTKRLIVENFFTFAFDYRQEWLRFIATMSPSDHKSSLYERAVQAVADVFECSVGAIYVGRPDGSFAIAGRWKWPDVAQTRILPSALTDSIRRHGEVLELSAKDEAFAPLLAQRDVRAWLEDLGDAWFALPLRSRNQVVGVVVLGQPRARRQLTWEDKDLLGILSVQIASYVVEEQATRSLAAVQRFEQVGKRFTFIAHDLKNLVSQLTLVLHHAEQHGANPEFQRDALATVKGSVAKMQRMLVRLRETESSEVSDAVELGRAIAEVVGAARPARARIIVQSRLPEIWVRADHLQLVGILQNVLQNALEAIAADGRIQIDLSRNGSNAVVEISDNGRGMTPAFVEQQLFQAFATTKGEGYGVGLYQTRETLERWGGGIDIDSTPDRGTAIRLRLVAMEAPPGTDEPDIQPARMAEGVR